MNPTKVIAFGGCEVVKVKVNTKLKMKSMKKSKKKSIKKSMKKSMKKSAINAYHFLKIRIKKVKKLKMK
jgi:hypothetical protein